MKMFHDCAYTCGITRICNKRSFNAFFQTSLEYCKIDIHPILVLCGVVVCCLRYVYLLHTKDLRAIGGQQVLSAFIVALLGSEGAGCTP